MKALNLIAERSGIVAANDEHAQWNMVNCGDRVQESREALFFPIITDQKQSKLIF